MRVLIFSRFFPSYHPRKGEPTFFVEKILRNFWRNESQQWVDPVVGEVVKMYVDVIAAIKNVNHYSPKLHTIRAGHRWKVGDVFSPRVWSDKPYRSKQIEIAPPIKIKKIYDITKEPHRENGFVFHINGDHYVADFKLETANVKLKDLARNDGLDKEDFVKWFPNSFDGQIICWKDPKYLP